VFEKKNARFMGLIQRQIIDIFFLKWPKHIGNMVVHMKILK
jgi:hypothetical protein